jgi:hypothetical protein
MTRLNVSVFVLCLVAASLAEAQPPAPATEFAEAAPAVTAASPPPPAVVIVPSDSPSPATSVPIAKETPLPRITSTAESEPTCQPLGRSWHSCEYLLWWIKDSRLPPLVTTSLSGAVPVLGGPETLVLYGGSQVDNEERSGGRFTLGMGLDSSGMVGLEGTYFFLGTRTTSFVAGSSGLVGTAFVGRPFFDVTTGQEAVYPVAIPGVSAGSVAVDLTSRMQGAELNGVASLFGNSFLQLTALVGFRYLELDEGLNVSDRIVVGPNRLNVDKSTLSEADQFDAHNRFYGGQVGGGVVLQNGPIFLDMLGKVALGETYEVVRIHGLSGAGVPGQAPDVQPGGVLALATNSGRFTHEALAVVPEARVRVGYQYRDRSRLYVGYSFVYLSDVARPGDQIDRGLNPTQIPPGPRLGPLIGPPRPQVTMQRTDIWAQGLTVGVEYRY